MVDLAGDGLPLPRGETLDGVSLRPALINPAAATGFKPYALSQFPRCPSDTSNASMFWKDNMCEWVERQEIFSMGFSIRIFSEEHRKPPENLSLYIYRYWAEQVPHAGG
jgi:hypothetical protein